MKRLLMGAMAIALIGLLGATAPAGADQRARIKRLQPPSMDGDPHYPDIAMPTFESGTLEGDSRTSSDLTTTSPCGINRDQHPSFDTRSNVPALVTMMRTLRRILWYLH